MIETARKLKGFLFENRSVRQTVMKNTFWLGVTQIAGRVLRGLVIIYAARILGAESWGAFSYALGIAAFLTIFSDIGITGIITREAASKTELRGQYLATGFILKTIILIVEIAAFLAVAPFLSANKEVQSLFPIIAFIVALDGLRDLVNGLARATERFELETNSAVITNAAIIILGFALLMVHPTSQALASSYIVGSFLGLIAIIYPFRDYFIGIGTNFSRELVKPILTGAWPFGLMGLMGAIMINTDLIMIGIFRSVTEVGFYSAAQRPIQLLYVLAGLISTPLFPLMTRLTGRRDAFIEIMRKGLTLITIIAVPATIGCFLLAKDITLFLFGSEYESASIPFQILSLTFLTTFLGSMFGNAVYALRKEKNLITYAILGAGGNLLFNLLLIPAYGIEGSAWSTVITQLISNIYIWIKMWPYVGWGFIARIKKTFIASAVLAAFVLLAARIELHVLLIVALGTGLYIALLFLLKEPMIGEIFRVFRNASAREEAV